ncbi:RagB/SusD family nutrient uptake outer membrane protein [Sphingobacterium rhinopitheci]|uniref:RagB/SusD family nutrient uptake outer membrane protein n=1 Tax=Sphingobacterium rhinopitheci TaxID=2781960 RepID=UPI001F529043|nr:RagB/SusD family nutrient uptake outer membrane protein [Sphingobacterium rhinopitheci]MCI0922405.1 RagB/SusD family nutrient uptake outer membrane protein [Sphingobacterium rhinopitheci]
MKKQTYILLFLPLFLMLGCNKYLDLQSNNALVVPKSLDDFQKLLDANSFINFNMCSNGEISADDYFLKTTVFEQFSDDARDLYLWRNFNYLFNNDWAKAYIPIYTSNLVLEGLEKLAITESNKDEFNRIKGSALYVRGSQLLSLVWVFAKAYNPNTSSSDLGVVLRSSSNPNETSKRASVEESYNFILNDLKDAVKYLPKVSTHVMRPSQSAAFASLARTYLSMSVYDSAYYYADKALESNNELIDFNQLTKTSPYPLERFNKETIYYAQLAPMYPNIHPFYASIDTLLYNSYHVDDLRKDIYFSQTGDGYFQFKGSYCGSIDLFGGIATDELYLIRAESAARLNNISSALNDLNTLLQKRWITGRYVALATDDNDVLVNTILEERRKELLMRGLRWIDIKRLNVLNGSISIVRKLNGETYTLPANDNRFALPLPQDVIQSSGMPQNPY